jgi:hypothetical protein
VIVCLLDREPVFANMTDCDRYEPREEEPPSALNPAPKERAG